jgi:cell wall-associated NlpC family hydrolase
MKSVPAWVGRYIGIPFAEAGGDRKGCNCWGLVRLVLAEQKAIALPAYAEISAAEMLKAARAFGADSKLDPWRPVERAEVAAFDVVLMHALTDAVARRIPGHVGIMVAPARVLHVWRGTDAIHMPLDHSDFQNKVIGFYRHRGLMQ